MNRDLLGDAIVDSPPKVLEGAEPKEATIFRVASWYAPGRYWKIWSDDWQQRENAERWIAQTLSTIRGHTHATVIEIRLPGIKKYV